jgi:hypothetical protein
VFFLSSLLLNPDIKPTPRLIRQAYYIEGFSGRAIPEFLGSEDPRRAHGVALGVVLNAPRSLRWGRLVPKVFVEGYYHRSVSPGASEQPPNGTDAYGILHFIRYELTPEKPTSFYFDIGMGLQYADQRTVDLSGRLSSTPTLGIGVAFRSSGLTYYLGARFFHISNAGFQGNNQGQNQTLITFGVKF